MKKKSVISALTLAAMMGAALALPATAAAHGMEKKRVKIVETEYRGGDSHHRRGERHRVDHRHHGRGHGHRHGHRGHKHRHVRREHRHKYYEPREVKRERPTHHRRDDGVRVRIDYDFWL